MTTGGFTSEQLELEERVLVLPHCDLKDAVTIGEIAVAMARRESLAISIEIRLGLPVRRALSWQPLTPRC
jgi:uncharacterized protein (UPF0303 family)